MNWIKTSERLPDRVEGMRYSTVQCLVVHTRKWKERTIKEVKILTFNHEHECWDDEDGDDHYCDIQDCQYWIELPEPPTDEVSK